jgi:hypothetical protein
MSKIIRIITDIVPLLMSTLRQFSLKEWGLDAENNGARDYAHAGEKVRLGRGEPEHRHDVHKVTGVMIEQKVGVS